MAVSVKTDATSINILNQCNSWIQHKRSCMCTEITTYIHNFPSSSSASKSLLLWILHLCFMSSVSLTQFHHKLPEISNINENVLKHTTQRQRNQTRCETCNSLGIGLLEDEVKSCGHRASKKCKPLTIQGRLKLDSSKASTTSTAGSRRLVAMGMQERMRTGTCGDAHLSCTMVLSSILLPDTENVHRGHTVSIPHIHRQHSKKNLSLIHIWRCRRTG